MNHGIGIYAQKYVGDLTQAVKGLARESTITR
jgi:hypothetical protein